MPGFTAGLSYMHESERLRPAAMNFSKDLADNDGEGLWPFERWGDFSADVVRLDAEAPVFPREEGGATSLDLFADAKISLLRGTERAFDHNAIFYARLPELVILWTGGGSERSRNTLAVAGARFEHRFGAGFALTAKVLVQDSGVRFGGGGNERSPARAGIRRGRPAVPESRDHDRLRADAVRAPRERQRLPRKERPGGTDLPVGRSERRRRLPARRGGRARRNDGRPLPRGRRPGSRPRSGRGSWSR